MRDCTEIGGSLRSLPYGPVEAEQPEVPVRGEVCAAIKGDDDPGLAGRPYKGPETKRPPSVDSAQRRGSVRRAAERPVQHPLAAPNGSSRVSTKGAEASVERSRRWTENPGCDVLEKK